MNLGENQVDTLVWAEQTTPTVYQPRGSMTLKALLIKPVSFGGEGYDLKHNTSNTVQSWLLSQYVSTKETKGTKI